MSWAVTEAGGGTIDTDGLYTAPAELNTFHVVATSNAEASLHATATVTVEACASLPEPGTWENSTPVDYGSNAGALIIDPSDANSVWLGSGTENKQLWRSQSCGNSVTWQQIGPSPGDGRQWSMVADPSDGDTMYAVAGYGQTGLWKTTDAGVQWQDVLAETEFGDHANGRDITNVSMDDTDHEHLVVAARGGCSAPYAPNCMAETHDGGETWRTFAVHDPGWQDGSGIVIVKQNTWVWCGSKLLVTEDAGATWAAGLEGDGAGCSAQNTIRPLSPAKNGNYYLGSLQGVLRSADGVHWQHIVSSSATLATIAQSESHVFAADSRHAVLRYASLDDDTVWTDLPTPSWLPPDQGIAFLAYDPTASRHLLYASMGSAGVGRFVLDE